MDLRPTIQRLGRDYTVTRRTVGPRVDGRTQPGTSSTFTIRAVIHPATAGGTQKVPEGARADDVFEVRSTTQLQAANAEDQTMPDRIAYAGSVLEILTASAWDPHGQYCAATAIRRAE